MLHGCTMSQIINPASFNALAKVKIVIYLTVGLYAIFAVLNGTTFFSEWEAQMIFGGVLAAVCVGAFIWLGYTIQKYPKS